jgi:alpha-beta hydrolase superfamily lysophospholipase
MDRLIAITLLICFTAIPRSEAGFALNLFFNECRAQAGDPKKYEIADRRGVTNIEFRSFDGATLRGYRIAAHTAKTRGVILVAQGNAQLAKRLVTPLQSFAAAGFDVHLYDYRSLGESSGLASVEGIFRDYRGILDQLRQQYDGRWVVGYGVSAGGIMLLNAVGEMKPKTALILDATPDKVPLLIAFEFPRGAIASARIKTIGRDLRHVMAISGRKDNKVKESNMRVLRQTISSSGGQVVSDAELAHPYEANDNVQRRLAIIGTFLSRLN